MKNDKPSRRWKEEEEDAAVFYFVHLFVSTANGRPFIECVCVCVCDVEARAEDERKENEKEKRRSP